MIEKLKLMEVTPAEPPPAGATSDTPKVMCREHGRPCVVFCCEEDCLQMLCAYCPILDHYDHKLIGISEKQENSEYFKTLKEVLGLEKRDLEHLLEGFKRNIDLLTKTKEDIWNNIDRKVDSILKEATELKKKTQDIVKKETDKITAKEEKVKHCIEKGIETVSAIEEQQKACAGYINAFQMQRAQQTLHEFREFTAEESSEEATKFAVPLLSLGHGGPGPVIGKINDKWTVFSR